MSDSSVLEQVGELFDHQLLLWLTKGKPVYDQNGELIHYNRNLTKDDWREIGRRLAIAKILPSKELVDFSQTVQHHLKIAGYTLPDEGDLPTTDPSTTDENRL